MSKTLENLTKAFIGESQARNRYTYYARQAQKEGLEQIAGIFLETAEQEKTHAKRLFEHIQKLKGDQAEITVETACPTVYENTLKNLEAAVAGEHHEYTQMYPEFAVIADEEGFSEIAARMRAIAIAENHHEARYLKLIENIQAGKVFEKDEEVVWICRECGYLHIGKKAPEKCPSCDHPTAFYQVQSENY
ncbi:MAG: rubrerythrin family protein [Patescibacteria group bacterium]